MTEPTARQVLYALVALGFHIVVGVLIIGAATADLVTWTATVAWAIVWTAGLVWGVFRWRRTVQVLAMSIALFAIWTIATLMST